MSKKYYKGFNKDMTCRVFQFEEGKTYEEPEAKLCEKGFHACENPLDCWNYYDVMGSVFHEVELDGVSEERHSNDTKVCAKKITVGARLDMKGLVKASVDVVLKSVKGCFDKKLFDKKIVDSGDAAKIGSSGNAAKIEITGERSIGACVGSGGKIKAKVGCWIVLSEWKVVENKYTPVCVKAVQVDGEKVKADTWYTLKDGELVEVQDEESRD